MILWLIRNLGIEIEKVSPVAPRSITTSPSRADASIPRALERHERSQRNRKIGLMSKYPVPECVITFNTETRLYAFTMSFPGKPPHYKMDVFDSVKSVLEWV